MLRVQVCKICFGNLRLCNAGVQAGHRYVHGILAVFVIRFLSSGFSCLAFFFFFSFWSQVVQVRITCSGSISYIAETALGISVFFVKACVQHTK